MDATETVVRYWPVLWDSKHKLVKLEKSFTEISFIEELSIV